METGMDRRRFLKGAAVGAIGLAAAGVAAGCTNGNSNPSLSENGNEPGTANGTGTGYLTAETATGKWAFEIPPEPIVDADIAETRESEIIIVGAGTAGLCAANTAAEAGAKVILFAMGSGPVGRGGSNFAFHSKYRESLGLEPVKPYPYLYNQIASNSFNVDQDKWYKWYRHSEEAMNWLIDIMDEAGGYQLFLEQIIHGSSMDDPTAPEWDALATHGWINDEMTRSGDGQPFVVNELAKRAQSLGVEIIYNMTAQQLVRGGVPNGTSGRVEAVIASDKDGKYTKFVGTRAIVLATGDFSTDRDMMTKYAPQAVDFMTNYDAEDIDPENDKVYGGLYSGMGQKMGLWIGAAWQKTYPNAAMGIVFGPGADEIGCMLGPDGRRFFSESLTFGSTFLELAFHARKNTMYQVWDSAYAETGKPWPASKSGYTMPFLTAEDKIKAWDESVEKGNYVKADTIEEVIEKLGLPAEALDEINKYNGFCEAGLDTDFYKRPGLLIPIKTPPFYGAGGKELRPIMHTVLGGLRTDINMKVCDADDEPIPGLYNVGSMIGDSYASAYTFKIPGQNYGMNCVTFGYLTGKYIAENE
jgi:succinate dehydrogenase/fumarate reductase flavoprotein subunit